MPPAGTGDLAWVTEIDFNGVARNGVADIGAYRFSDPDDLRWAIQAGKKVLPIFSDGFESGDTAAW